MASDTWSMSGDTAAADAPAVTSAPPPPPPRRRTSRKIPEDAVRVTTCEYEALLACLKANDNDHRQCRKEIQAFEAGTACGQTEGENLIHQAQQSKQ